MLVTHIGMNEQLIYKLYRGLFDQFDTNNIVSTAIKTIANKNR